ncbi:tumor necrosis factor alpha-induced protein 2-like [Centropristis striata]|uniref:tumor necrosis factor alpha-induced protein 2-like n=1 Tax=Centropristis striata TaxID=184440 RepID=UPI0027DEF156|nr:tumor necrosis factor alpha-induced protein 2-like [Centropristis striata]
MVTSSYDCPDLIRHILDPLDPLVPGLGPSGSWSWTLWTLWLWILVLLRMWSSLVSSKGQQSSSAAEGERRMPHLKNPVKAWRNRRQQNHTDTAESECEEDLEQLEEQLEEVSRTLIFREEQLFSQDSPSEEDQDQLHTDLEALTLQLWTAVDNTFTSSCSSSPDHLEVLKSAVASIQQQEEQDRRWTDCPEERVPPWRPQKCLSKHNTLLQNLVETRLTHAAQNQDSSTDGLSSSLKRQVCGMGRRVKEDLLVVVRAVQDCYPPQMDILNLYSGLFHRSFSARLTELAAAGPEPEPELEPDDRSYLLFWINHCYPHEILNHEELKGKIKTACLGSLLLQDHLDRLEDQYLNHQEDKLKLWLNAALRKEEESWLSGQNPELLDRYRFSPLAVDIIQVIDSSLSEVSHVIRDQSKGHNRVTAHLDSFLSSYEKCVEEFMKGNHGNARSVIKAQLVCEQQLRDYITAQTGSLSEPQRQRCVDALSALKDCGYRCLTCPPQLKVGLAQLWAPGWVDGSLPVVDSLLDSLDRQLSDLSDLKPTCRQSVLSVLQEDLVLQYVKRTLRTRTRSREQQVGGAQRMTEDARKISDFFQQEGGGTPWLGEMLCSVAEVLRLQDPGSVQLEVVSLARRFPDLSSAHVAALLSLKAGLSAADIRSIRRSVEENRPLGASTNQSPPFFSRVKVKWINKINKMLA